ncbi:restriction endonuclease [Xanthomonas sp. XNM01]|uniref:restriction endonuclease n=1 Tax=Xanthomonas sp. XNM01 TaxID=2769289 RepID=UPI0017830F98|nr:restriction endonuclease [Xanthomonas sp. XNM01]MBD9369236.1 restriction endonuclease [Xanthomonas sp. XNM01]
MRQGLMRAAHRRDDALTGMRWGRLEHLLAVYYRDAGYQVTHVGTGATAGRFDGGINLELRRDGCLVLVLVQVKHWKACKVGHNDAHQLIGVMVNAKANGAIVVTSGEFTRAAIEAAARNGRVQLIDGDELRAMLGLLPDAPPAAIRIADTLAAQVGEQLLNAAMGRAVPAGRRAAKSWAKATGVRSVLHPPVDRVPGDPRAELESESESPEHRTACRRFATVDYKPKRHRQRDVHSCGQHLLYRTRFLYGHYPRSPHRARHAS